MQLFVQDKKKNIFFCNSWGEVSIETKPTRGDEKTNPPKRQQNAVKISKILY